MRLLYVHGAGGLVHDRALAAALGQGMGVAVEMPDIACDDMSLEAWSARVRQYLAGLGPEDVVIGHSFGGTVLEWVLPELGWAPRKVLLLGMPDWSADGWDQPQYLHRGPEPSTALSLHHCRDDDIVPFEHLALNANRLGSAQVFEHPRGGHAFDGLVDVLAADAVRPG